MGSISQKRQREQVWNKMNRKSLMISKQGALIKQSKYLKQWRQRTIILYQQYIATFDNRQEIPTALIPISIVLSLVKREQDKFFILIIITKQQEEYKFRTENDHQREEWFGMIKQLKMNEMKKSFGGFSVKTQENDKRLTFQQGQ